MVQFLKIGSSKRKEMVIELFIFKISPRFPFSFFLYCFRLTLVALIQSRIQLVAVWYVTRYIKNDT